MKFATLQELFADPARWTTGKTARDVHGHSTYAKSDGACSWCLIGGLERVYGDVYIGPRKKLREAIERRVGPRSITGFNDDAATTIDDIRAVVAEAGV